MSPVVQETYAFAYMVPNVKHKGVVMWGVKTCFCPRNSVSLVIPFTWLQCLHHITHTHFEFSVYLVFAYFWTHAAFSEASIARSCCSIDFVLSCWMLDLTTSTDFVFWFLHPPFLNVFFKWSHMVLQWNFVTTLHCGLFFHCQ